MRIMPSRDVWFTSGEISRILPSTAAGQPATLTLTGMPSESLGRAASGISAASSNSLLSAIRNSGPPCDETMPPRIALRASTSPSLGAFTSVLSIWMRTLFSCAAITAICAFDQSSVRLAVSNLAVALSLALTALSRSAWVANPPRAGRRTIERILAGLTHHDLGIGDLRLGLRRCWPRPGCGSPRSGPAGCRAWSDRARPAPAPFFTCRPGRR